MIKKENIHFNDELNSKSEVFELIANKVASSNTSLKKVIIAGLNKREEEVSTGFEDGIAIPHSRIEGIDEPILSVIKTKGIDWPSMDGKPTTFIICILVPTNKGEEHLKILSNLTRKLVDKEYRDALKNASKEEIVKLIAQAQNNGSENKDVNTTKEIVDEKYYLGITKCPVGIAHTYMAAEKLESAAKKMGYKIKVEAQGSAGVENKITSADIQRAEAVIIAADAAIEGKGRFVGKKVLETNIKPALEDPEGLIRKSDNAPVLQGQKEEDIGDVTIMKAIMNGVSHMIPFVVLGGLLIALSLSLGHTSIVDGSVQIDTGTFWWKVNQIGSIGFELMIPILAGYIAYALAGRAALAPAMIGAMVANSPDILGTKAGCGFLGALAVGVIAGYLVRWINTWKIPKEIRPIMPIFVIPILATLVISALFIFILAWPIIFITNALNNFLTYLSSNPALTIFLGISLGAMVSFDMGGPVNKVAFLFGVSSITTNPQIMGAVAAAIAVPPLSMGLATLIKPSKFTEEERGTGIAAILMGLIGITEGAIPFAASDPKRVIPSIMIGSAVASTLALFFKVTNVVPHGGPIVGLLGATSNVLLYFLAIIIGMIVSAIIVVTIKKDIVEDKK